jgi:transposase
MSSTSSTFSPSTEPTATTGTATPPMTPKTLLAVLLDAYCIGVRSSQQIERRCQEDIAFRILAGNQPPDHVTIARFRVRHESALAGFLVESLKLCAAAGMVRVSTVAPDGTKLAGNASTQSVQPPRADARDPACLMSLLPGVFTSGQRPGRAG